MSWQQPLPQNWQQVFEKGWHNNLADKIHFQYQSINSTILAGFQLLPADSKFVLSYEALLSALAKQVQKLCTFCNIPFGPKMQALCQDGSIPPYTVSRDNQNLLQQAATEKGHKPCFSTSR